MMLPLLSGCILETSARGDAGKFRVNVECEEGSTVDVELNLDRDEQRKRAEQTRVPIAP